MIKVVVLGVGHLGSIHAKLWKENPSVKLVGIYDVDAEKCRTKAAELQVECFEDIDQAVQTCNAVTIAVPTSEHFSIAEKCIMANRHCLIEKPITHTYEEALTLISLERECGTVLQVGHVERFNPAFVAVQSYVKNPMFIESHRLSQFKPRAIDVSVIHDLMIHDIDIALWLIKSPAIRIDANGVAVLTDTPDIANARIEFENGAVVNLTASRISASSMRKMRIFQKDAYLSVDFSKPGVDVYRLSEDNSSSHSAVPAVMLGQIDAGTQKKNIVFEQPVIVSTNAIAEEQKSFIRSIESGEKVSVSSTDASEALRIASEISRLIELRSSGN